MYAIIYNPAAGNGCGERSMYSVTGRLNELGIPYQLFRSRFPGHPTQLAREAVDLGFREVLAVGGDGTLMEVARGLVGSGATLGMLPAGTGNDFRRTFSLPAEPLAALERILRNNRILVDVGRFNGQCFLNQLGTGFDTAMNDRQLRFKRLGGMASYVLAVLLTIFDYRYPRLRLAVDGGEPHPIVPLLINVANGQYFGGGMHIFPEASAQDGLLEVMVVERLPRWRIPLLFPRLIKGTLTQRKYPFLHTYRAREVLLEGEAIPLQVDGELMQGGDRVQIELAPQRLSIFI